MSEAVNLGAIFAGLSHELGQPLTLALGNVNQAAPDLCQVRGAVERVAQGCKLFSWLASTLAGEPSAEKVLRPCLISKTAQKLASQNQLQVRVSDDLAVLAAWDALERVLCASIEYIRQHSCLSSPDGAIILASEVLPADANRVPPGPQNRPARSIVRLTVGTGQTDRNSWLPVPAHESKASFGDFLLQAGHYELWLCLLIVRANGGDLWLEESTAGTVVTSLWRKAPKLRGFATISRERNRQLASLGGRTAQRKGTGHQFTSEQARAAGQKGGRTVSQWAGYMSELGRKGALAAAAKRRGER